MLLAKLIGPLFGVLTLLVSIPFFSAAKCVLTQPKNFVGWNITALEQQLKRKDTFVFYYGTDRCPSCREAKKALKGNTKWQTAVKQFKEQKKQPFAVYWYSEYVYSPKGTKRRAFDQKLIAVFKKYNVVNGTKMVESGVPLLIFFKNGQNQNTTNAWKGPKAIASLVQQLEDLRS